MIEQAHEARNRNRNRGITEDQITHRMIVSPDVKKIQDELKTKDQLKRKGKGKKDGVRNTK